MHLADLIPIPQISIGPVILISGVGLLIGSMNNRLGRTIDRSRVTIEARNRATDPVVRSRRMTNWRSFGVALKSYAQPLHSPPSAFCWWQF